MSEEKTCESCRFSRDAYTTEYRGGAASEDHIRLHDAVWCTKLGGHGPHAEGRSGPIQITKSSNISSGPDVAVPRDFYCQYHSE